MLATPGSLAFLALLVLVGAARIGELIVARRLTARAAARGAQPEREPAFVAMVVLHTVPFWLAPLEVGFFDRPFLPVLFAASATAMLLLAVARYWTLRTLGDMWNVRIVRPAHVVSAGPYQFVRHPNYAIVIAELFVLPLAHTAIITCVFVTIANGLVLWRRVPREERVLDALPGYRELMGGKPRFVPSLRGSANTRRAA